MNPENQLEQVKLFESNMNSLLKRLQEIQRERKKLGSDLDCNLSTLIGLLDLYHQHFLAILFVADEQPIDRKKLCLKFKGLSRDFLMKISSHKICWKFLTIAAAKFDTILEKELKFILDNFYYFGETELCEYYNSRVVLLVRSAHIRHRSSSKSSTTFLLASLEKMKTSSDCPKKRMN